MKCPHCGCESPETVSYCPVCGCPVQSGWVAPVSVANDAAPTILAALKDKLFLALCILFSANCAVSLLSGGLPVISILVTVFLWLAYAKASRNVADPSHIRQVSGTIFASYVLTYILGGLIVLLGIFFGAMVNALTNAPELWAQIVQEVSKTDPSVAQVFAQYAGSFDYFAAEMGVVLLLVFLVMGGGIILVNVFSWRYIHQFVKSLYKSLQAGRLELKHTRGARGWLIVFAVVAGLDVIGSLGSGAWALLGSSTMCAIYAVAAAWVGKYFPKGRQ